MRKAGLLLCFFVAALLPCVAQNLPLAKQLVNEGLHLQHSGRYHAALKKFEQALQHDPANLQALSEKSFSLLAMQHYGAALLVAENALREHKATEDLLMLYLNRANALDYLGRHQQALAAYDEGLKAYPNAQQLHLNKGITLANLGRFAEAQAAFERAVRAQPSDPDPHLAMARLSASLQQRVPALMAFCRFLVLEPEGRRAHQSLRHVKRLMAHNTKHDRKGKLTINIDKSLLPDSAQPAYPNDFRIPELALTLASGVDLKRNGKELPETEQFALRFGAFCSSLRDNAPTGTGFFWEFYAPYFIELYEVQLVRPFAYVVHASGRKKHVKRWLAANELELGRFFAWTDIYPWQHYRYR